MDISSANTTYSGYEASLTTPFLGKRITINAYTQFNEPKPVEPDVVYSRSDFYNINRLSQRVTVTEEGVTPHQSKVIVQNYIQNGMSPLDAVQAYKAQLTYGTSANVDGVGLLSSQGTET